MNADHRAQNHGVSLARHIRRQLDSLEEFTFEVDRRILDPGRLDRLRGFHGEAGEDELVNLGGHLGGGFVHFPVLGLIDDIDHELVGVLGVLPGVLLAVGQRPAAATEHHHRRIRRDAVEEAVRPQVEYAIGADRGNPADGPGHHQALERVAWQAVGIVAGVVEHDGIPCECQAARI